VVTDDVALSSCASKELMRERKIAAEINNGLGVRMFVSCVNNCLRFMNNVHVQIGRDFMVPFILT